MAGHDEEVSEEAPGQCSFFVLDCRLKLGYIVQVRGTRDAPEASVVAADAALRGSGLANLSASRVPSRDEARGIRSGGAASLCPSASPAPV
jgi:hypothetical protein